MINSPPTISPRLRTREPIGVAAPSALARSVEPAALRVLIRLPQIAPPSATAGRFQFAATLFSTLKRKYAAAAFSVFVVCIAIMLLRGKKAPPANDDLGGEAPRWNSTLTVTPKTDAAVSPMAVQPPAPRSEAAARWSIGPQRASEAPRQSPIDATSWQQPAGSSAVAGKSNTPLPTDRIPAPPNNPWQNNVATRPYPAAPPASNGANLRIAERDAAAAPPAGGTSIYNDQSGVARLRGTIGNPQPTISDPAGPRNYR